MNDGSDAVVSSGPPEAAPEWLKKAMPTDRDQLVSLDDFIVAYVSAACDLLGGNQSAVAERLAMHRQTVKRYLAMSKKI